MGRLMADLGFLGLGTMGTEIALRLIGAGHSVRVWNRTPEAADDLVAAGAVRAESAADALAADVSFSMLANDEAAEAVLTEQALAGAPGRVHVNLASISPEAADRLTDLHARAGVTYVAATVLGRSTVAAAGKLNIMAAGPAATVDALEPYFSELGVRTWRMGERPRMANVVKAAVNYNIIHAIQALGESITLVEGHGVDGKEFVELLGSSLFGGIVYTGYGAAIAERRYTPPGFLMELGRKDLTLAERAAAEVGVELPTAAVLHELFDAAMADAELRTYDWAALAEVTRRRRR
jgi:3-hydroxyisobutyrate dehydrogenase-like beta-hydroxyacid dehydrogenase